MGLFFPVDGNKKSDPRGTVKFLSLSLIDGHILVS